MKKGTSFGIFLRKFNGKAINKETAKNKLLKFSDNFKITITQN